MTIPNQLSGGDVRVLDAVMKLFQDYTYMEIGSYLGGSLQQHLTNPTCKQAISVDTRSTGQIRDERNIDYRYTVSTNDMIKTLHEHDIPTERLITVDGTIDDVATQDVDLIFVDGEHTNSAVLNDATSCLRFQPTIILFHDDWIVYQGIEKAAQQAAEYQLHKIADSDITALCHKSWEQQLKLKTVPWETFVNNVKRKVGYYENT